MSRQVLFGEIKDSALTERVVRAFAKITMIIVEFDYFDLDYRSEFSVTHETTFAARDPSTVRLHFFGGDNHPQEGQAIQEAARVAADDYSGYVVLRPQQPGAIGRSMIAPLAIPVELADGEDLASHVRTAVREQVNLFGVALSATGVPFMEQDGRLLRCVHAAAWMCHFSAVLRGVVARRRSADIHRAEDATFALGRPYPSAGLTEQALNRVLNGIDLPAEFIPDGLFLASIIRASPLRSRS